MLEFPGRHHFGTFDVIALLSTESKGYPADNSGIRNTPHNSTWKHTEFQFENWQHLFPIYLAESTVESH